MSNLMRLKTVLVALLLCLGTASANGIDALAAIERGDYEKAFQILTPLAQQGNAQAQFLVGLMYQNGEGVTRNYSEAFNWFNKAAAQGERESFQRIGALYEKGLGVEKNSKVAISWYRKAAEQGLVSSQLRLGYIYWAGTLDKQDEREAFNWFKRASDQGNAEAQLKLGLLYAIGAGVKEDLSKAYVLLQKSAAQNYSEAFGQLVNLEKEMKRRGLEYPPKVVFETENNQIEYPTVAAAFEALKASPNTSSVVQAGWIVITEKSNAGVVNWSFTPDSHPAHPALVKRASVVKQGNLFVVMNVLCQASKTICDDLVQEFRSLNEKMADDFKGRSQ